jgi:hypothetical protein
MMLRRTLPEKLALTMLAREGIAAIWTLHVSASRAYREGHKAAAASLIEIADAAEREWLRGKAAMSASAGWRGPRGRPPLRP